MKFSGNKWIPFILTVLVIILLNVAASTLSLRADLTRNGMFSLSEASKRAVRTLEEPFTVKAFLSASLSPPYNNTEQILRDLLEEYSVEANRNFNYSIITIPSKDVLDSGKGTESADEANKYRIFPIQIQTIEQDEVKLQSVYMGIAFIHGDMIETIPALTNTSNLEYQITGIINDMGKKISALLGMTEDIQVTLYLSENMNEVNASFGERREGIETAVKELNEQYYGRLDFDVVDPVVTGEESYIESEYGVSPLTLTRQTNQGQESENGYAALVITHQEKHYAQNLMSRGIFGWQVRDVASLKQTLEDVTEAIIGTNEAMGFASGYGMPSLDGQQNTQAPINPITPELSNFNALLSREYTLETVSLPDEQIPEGIRCLIIPGPSTKLSEYDLYKIDQFLVKGGSLALFLDPFSVYMTQSQQFGQQEPEYIPRETGLELMLSHYGVDLKKAFVLDERSFTQRQRTASGSIVETPVYYAPVITEERISNELQILRNVPEIILLYSAPLELNDNLPKDVSAIPLITSSADSWAMEEDINLSYPQLIEPPPDDMQSPQVLAYLLEGEFESYFSGRAVPQPPEPVTGEGDEPDEGAQAGDLIARDAVTVQETMRERGTGKLFVIGSSAVLGSNLLDAEGQTGNSLFFVNIFDYLNGREDYAIMRSKGVNFVPIGENVSPQAKSFIKSFNIAVLPALVVVSGVLVWVGRMRRKKRIEYFFLKGGEHAE